VLPIVRPSSSTAAVSSSSPTRPSAPHSSRGRGGSSSAAGGFHSGSSWQQLGATQDVIDALSALGISRPSHVQAEAYAALSPKSGFRHVALADQAGSGKTLAYLLPLLQQLKAREAAQGGGPVTQPNSASIVVVTPTTGE
jgi:ATP-dependent RNA helicase DDX18/HAS1